jgi:putative transposase
MVTAGTYLKKSFFSTRERLTFLCDTLLQLAELHGWKLQAWAVFPNHYHFVGESSDPKSLRPLIQAIHSIAAREANRLDGTGGRRVWFEYWDTHLSSQRSYFARLNYVHQNAVHHGVVRVASAYPFCSAGWFERTAEPAFYRTIVSFPCDRVRVPDDYEVKLAGS